MGQREEKRGDRRYPSLVWPVLLITAGVLFLLSNMDLLEVNLWDLWRLWPVLLILAGLEIFLGRRSLVGSIIALVITIAVVAGVVILLVTAPDVLAPSVSEGISQISEPLEVVEQASLEVDFAAGQLDITTLSDSSSLIEGHLQLATGRRPAWEIDRKGDRADMTLAYKRGFESWNWPDDEEWDLRLSPEASFSLDVNLGAGVATIDLTGLDIQDLSVDTGASQTTIVFPQEGDFSAVVDGGVGQLALEIPRQMAARIRVDRGVSALDISRRFDKDGDLYLTDDWWTNENRVDLEVDIGVGLVTVREP